MTQYTPSNPDFRLGLNEENPLAAANKQPSGSRPGPVAPKTHAPLKGGNSDSAPGAGKHNSNESAKPTKANPRKIR